MESIRKKKMYAFSFLLKIPISFRINRFTLYLVEMILGRMENIEWKTEWKTVFFTIWKRKEKTDEEHFVHNALPPTLIQDLLTYPLDAFCPQSLFCLFSPLYLQSTPNVHRFSPSFFFFSMWSIVSTSTGSMET